MITERQVLQAAKGNTILTWHGQRLEMKLNKEEWRQLEQAEAAGYIKVRRSQRALSTVWGYLCDVRRTPDVRLTLRVRYARLSADLLPAGLRLTEHGAALVNDLVGRYGRTGERIVESPGSTWVYFDVRIEGADQAITEMVAILRDTTAAESERALKLPDFIPTHKPSKYRITLTQLEQMFGTLVALANQARRLKLDSGIETTVWLAYEVEPRLQAIRAAAHPNTCGLYADLKDRGRELEYDIREHYGRQQA